VNFLSAIELFVWINLNVLTIYLLFSIIIAEMMLSILFNNDSLDTLICHLTLDQFIISLEHSLNAFELDTFYDMNCRVDRDNFNDSEIMKKDEGLTQQMHWEILRVLMTWSFSCHHLFSLELISACWLSYILWKA